MLSDILLDCFLMALALVTITSLRRHAFAIVLGWAAFGLKQITLCKIPFLQTHYLWFNYTLATFIFLSFLIRLYFQHLPRLHLLSTVTLILIWSFALYFWVSALWWSPLQDREEDFQFIGYFILFCVFLPFLAEEHRPMLHAIYGLFFLLLIGLGGLLLSPFISDPETYGRLAVSINDEYANPLALADAGALLLLASVLVISTQGWSYRARLTKTAVMVALGVIGAVAGAWVSFQAARGEMVAALFATWLFVALVGTKGKVKTAALSVGGVAILAVFAIILYRFDYDQIVMNAPKFNAEKIYNDLADRVYLIAGGLEIATQSLSTMLFGIGGRGCEEVLGMYPHNVLVQALSDTGAFGFLLFAGFNATAITLGLRTISEAKKRYDAVALKVSAFLFCGMIYALICSLKRGSLTYHDGFMWPAVLVVSCSRILTTMAEPHGAKRCQSPSVLPQIAGTNAAPISSEHCITGAVLDFTEGPETVRKS